MSAREATDRVAIRDTLDRYNLAGDRGRLDDLAACFTEDGVLEIRDDWVARGRAEIIQRLDSARAVFASPGHRPLVRHHLTTHRAEFLSETESRAWTYFLVITATGPDHSGRYVDHLQKVADSWLLSHRTVIVEWRTEGPKIPSAS